MVSYNLKSFFLTQLHNIQALFWYLIWVFLILWNGLCESVTLSKFIIKKKEKYSHHIVVFIAIQHISIRKSLLT